MVVIGFMLLCLYGLVASFIWSDPAGTSGLAGLASIVFLMFSAVLLGVLATPLAITLSSRKKSGGICIGWHWSYQHLRGLAGGSP